MNWNLHLPVTQRSQRGLECNVLLELICHMLCDIQNYGSGCRSLWEKTVSSVPIYYNKDLIVIEAMHESRQGNDISSVSIAR